MENYNRPRRPSPDTLSYVKSLPLDEKVAQDEIVSFLEHERNKSSNNNNNNNNNEYDDDDEEEEVEYPQMLSAAMASVDEIQNEVASLAGDEVGSQRVETITRIIGPYSSIAIRKLLCGIKTYMVFLCTHRFGSHVVQTILQQALHAVDKEACHLLQLDQDEKEGGDSSSSSSTLPSIQDLLLDLSNELENCTCELAVHFCGSHALRTLLCVLGGVQEISSLNQSTSSSSSNNNNMNNGSGGSRRGKVKPKNKKKKKKKTSSDSTGVGGSNNGPSNANFIQFQRVTHTGFNVQDDNIKECLKSFVYEISGMTSNEANSNDATTSDKYASGNLQQLACDPSAGPMLIVLLRILTLSDSSTTTTTTTSASTTTTSTTNGNKRSLSNENDKTSTTNDNNVHIQNLKTIADSRLGIIPQEEERFKSSSLAEQLAKAILCWDDALDTIDCNIGATTTTTTTTTSTDTTTTKNNEDDVNNENNKNNKNKSISRVSDIIFGLSGEPHGSHVLEAILRLSNDQFYQQVCHFGAFFQPTPFHEYSQHQVSNFVIQTVINTVRNKQQVETVLKCAEQDIINGYVLDTKERRRGIFWRIVEMSSKWRVGQESLLKLMRKGFTHLHLHSNNQDDKSIISLQDCIPKLICFQPPEKEGGRISLDATGVRIVYNLLQFVPRLCDDVLTGIISKYSTEELIFIANDGLGSRCLLDGILEGPIKQKPFSTAVNQLYNKLNGKWVSLSVERVGHHLVRKVFNALKSMDDKVSLVTELSKSMNRLDGNAIGRSIITHCAIKDYMSGGESQWREIMKKKIDHEEFLKQMLETENDNGGKERKRSRKRKKSSHEAEAAAEDQD